ncbi:hypothetical protein GCM10011385_26310 [Nitratireductor aestuarii]|uniref:Uncharacterized protein n=1 Tax=Nitratireductor aestuarii TaxID=1735103 RepID=A0A916RVF6_9HYPH|nr:hypothetical protein [Nitratireductor aestuarii]GGA71173.1 hypothetical protein GCM10011385_26310 [Nitratireductor aestuarii]
MIDLTTFSPTTLLMLGSMAVVATGIGIIDFQAKRAHRRLRARRSELEQKLAAADIRATNSDWEEFARALKEALAAGDPRRKSEKLGANHRGQR